MCGFIWSKIKNNVKNIYISNFWHEAIVRLYFPKLKLKRTHWN